MLDKTFTAELESEGKKGGWTYILWLESSAFFETRKPVKVKGKMDGLPFEATFLPMGDGSHILPVKSPLLKSLKKKVGDSVEVVLEERL